MTGTPTPGPWEARNHHIYCEDTTVHIADICRAHDGDWSEANARLIAAAPDTAAERDRLLDLNAELVEALWKLSNEVMSWQEDDLIQVGGVTNTRVLIQRAREARETLAKAKP